METTTPLAGSTQVSSFEVISMKRINLCLVGLILFGGYFVLQFGTEVSSQSGRLENAALPYVNGMATIMGNMRNNRIFVRC